MTAKEDLRTAIDTALKYYDAGNQEAAVAAFLSEVASRKSIKPIGEKPGVMPDLKEKVQHGRNAFMLAMTDAAR